MWMIMLLVFAFCVSSDAQEIAPYATGTILTLTWVDNSANEDGFAIERKCGAETAFVEIGRVGKDIVTFTNTLDPGFGGKICGYRVFAYNTAGNSGYSNTATITIPQAPTPPAAPTNLLIR